MKHRRTLSLTACCLLTACLLLHTRALPALGQGAGADGEESRRLRRTPVVEVFESCREAVVNISSTQIVKVQSPLGIGSLFDDLFDVPNMGRTRQLRQTSVGSGFVIHPSGYVVTNAHVVARTVERKVIFADKSEFDAQVVAVDTERDLAVLKINADRPLKTIRLGTSADLMVGETVIAIGNPLGYQHTVTSGVVSALDRSIAVGNGVEFSGLVQTDASINPGNSGGPLLNVLGELIGINTAVRGDAQNIGFAIPVDQLRRTLPDMLAVERRYRIVTGMRIGIEGPAKVLAITSDTPAHQAGILPGDVVTQVNDQPIRNAIDMSIALIGLKAGDALDIRYTRDGKAASTRLALAGRPLPDGAALLRAKFGIVGEPLTPKAAEQLGLPGLRAIEVRSVEPDSPARDLGLRRGDLIDHLAGAPTTSLDDVGEIIENIPPGRRVPISVLRIDGRTLFRTQTAIDSR